jgi:hemolysin activation/secretion protein
LLLSLLSHAALAQVFPPAAPLQGGREPAAPPVRSSSTAVPRPAVSPSQALGSATIEIRQVEFAGNTQFTSEQLASLIAMKAGDKYSLSDFKGWTDRISEHYQKAGFPFASAFLPQQKIEAGVLKIEVIEGRYGKVSSTGDFLAEQAAPFLENLAPGQLIEARLLERTMLIIDDLPMIDVSPLVKPGQTYGTGDLVVQIKRLAENGGEVGLDNLGSRYTGQYRARLNHNLYSLWRFGDEIRLKLLASDKDLLLGSADYEMPLNGQGLRWQIGVARTSYQLAREYASLDAVGLAEVLSTRVGYPIARTQAHNLSVSLGLMSKHLKDEVGLTSTVNRKRTLAVPLTLVFDRRDAFLGGGLFYGNLIWAAGHLRLDEQLRQADALTARSEGQFRKLSLEITRLQTLPLNFSLMARYATQQASNNLDSSEKFSLGGIYGVRAYPSGQGVGDKGWLTQIELRQKLGDVTGFVFYDQGAVRSNVNPWDSASAAREKVSGSGLGVRKELPKGWNWELLMAFRDSSVLPSDNSSKGPRALGSVTYRY